ncbi:MAG: ABC transporter ATP-binding protein [Bacteroidetes bacterium]|nr:ABC transporter ATP-binding protein [Bacteroidota bacterium]
MKHRTALTPSTPHIIPPGIVFDHVQFSYGETPVLRDVTFAVEPGEFVGVIGPNGAGKTTLLRLLTGVRASSAGQVRIGERDVLSIPSNERAHLLAVVPQNESVIFPYTVEAMVLLGRFPHTSFLGYEREEDLRVARSTMELVGVAHLAARSVTDLSGGEQHRVLIARALAQQAPVLLLDEPNAHLDLHYQVALFDLLAKLHRDEGRTVLIITHDLNLAGMYCDRIILLSDGSAAAWGTPAEVLREDILEEHFRVNVRVDGGDRPHVRVVRAG